MAAPSSFGGVAGGGLASPSGGSRLSANRSPAAMKVLEFCASKPEVHSLVISLSFFVPSKSTATAARKKKKTQPRPRSKKNHSLCAGRHHLGHAFRAQVALAGRPGGCYQRAPGSGKEKEKSS